MWMYEPNHTNPLPIKSTYTHKNHISAHTDTQNHFSHTTFPQPPRPHPPHPFTPVSTLHSTLSTPTPYHNQYSYVIFINHVLLEVRNAIRTQQQPHSPTRPHHRPLVRNTRQDPSHNNVPTLSSNPHTHHLCPPIIQHIIQL